MKFNYLWILYLMIAFTSFEVIHNSQLKISLEDRGGIDELNKTSNQSYYFHLPYDYLQLTPIAYFPVLCVNNFSINSNRQIKFDKDGWGQNCEAGNYYSFSSQIKIATNYSVMVLAHTVSHEVGHHLYYHFLSGHEIKAYTSYYNKTKAINDYGKTNVQEDFAEYYALYNLRNQTNYYNYLIKNKDLRKEEFLNRILLEYPQFDLRGRMDFK